MENMHEEKNGSNGDKMLMSKSCVKNILQYSRGGRDISFMLKPGEECIVKREFMVDGQCAFTRGARVVIETIDADPQRPGLKHMVFSARLGKQVRLRGIDLQRANCENCGAELSPGECKCGGCGWVIPEKQSELMQKDRDSRRRREGTRGI